MEARVMKLSVFLILTVFLVGFVSAVPTVHFKTIPEKATWIADGRTSYRMDVYVDNTELHESTEGVQWDVIVPNKYVKVVDAQIPEFDKDFYAGSGMFFEFITTDLWNQGRLADIGQGKTDQTGFVGSYWFTVSPGFTGTTSFDLGNLIALAPNVQEQPADVSENVPFEIVNPKVGKLKHNGNNWFQRALNAFRG